MMSHGKIPACPGPFPLGLAKPNHGKPRKIVFTGREIRIQDFCYLPISLAALWEAT